MPLRSIIVSAVYVLLTHPPAASAMPVVFEVQLGDAGQSLETAHVAESARGEPGEEFDPGFAVRGLIHFAFDVDLYEIVVPDPSAFGARVTQFHEAHPYEDSSLFLFDDEGLLLAEDQAFGLARLGPFDGDPGRYFLAFTGFGNAPLLDAEGRLSGWDLRGVAFDDALYWLGLAGVIVPIPEPSTALLVLLGLGSIALHRHGRAESRRRHPTR